MIRTKPTHVHNTEPNAQVAVVEYLYDYPELPIIRPQLRALRKTCNYNIKYCIVIDDFNCYVLIINTISRVAHSASTSIVDLQPSI
jgi:hypothetical protein